MKEVGPQSGPSALPALPEAAACGPRYACVWPDLHRWRSAVGRPCVYRQHRRMQRQHLSS